MADPVLVHLVVANEEFYYISEGLELRLFLLLKILVHLEGLLLGFSH